MKPIPATSTRVQAAAVEHAIEWAVSDEPVAYEPALAAMETRAAEIAAGRARELVWLLEHPALYTAGTSAKIHDLINAGDFAVHQTGRGGQYTYHGPGQQIAYVMLDVKRRFGGDVRAFTRALEDWLIATLSVCGVVGFTIAGRTGVWVAAVANKAPAAANPIESHAKIAAIGLRIRHGISFHGVSLNVAPELAHYAGIVPCGLAGSRVTSLANLGRPASMHDVQAALRSSFTEYFGTSLQTVQGHDRI